MTYADAFIYVIDRAKTQMNYYIQSNDSSYLDIAEEYIKVAQIYLNNLRQTTESPVNSN